MTRIAHADKALNINEVVRHEPPPACLTARHALRTRHHAPRGRRFYSNEEYAYDGPRPPRASGNRTSHTVGAATYGYTYPATSQRLTKAGTGYTGTLRFVYGEDGKLLGEYDNTGALITEQA